MTLFRYLNMGLSFLLELLMLAALAYWGFTIGSDALSKGLLGLGAPLLAIIIWGLYNAPRAVRRLPTVPRILLELFMFTLAALALVHAGQPSAGLLFFSMVVVNLLLVYWWER